MFEVPSSTEWQFFRRNLESAAQNLSIRFCFYRKKTSTYILIFCFIYINVNRIFAANLENYGRI